VRVLLSCAIGDRLYPDRQWGRLASIWESMYPIAGVGPRLASTIAGLRETIPELVTVLVEHRSPRLRGRSLGQVLRNPTLGRASLLDRFRSWAADPNTMAAEPPTTAFAVLGQARASGQLTPEREASLLHELITHWAVASALETARSWGRPDTRSFVGQPRIWTDSPDRPQRLRAAI
jgi:hypothetical protein